MTTIKHKEHFFVDRKKKKILLNNFLFAYFNGKSLINTHFKKRISRKLSMVKLSMVVHKKIIDWFLLHNFQKENFSETDIFFLKNFF